MVVLSPLPRPVQLQRHVALPPGALLHLAVLPEAGDGANAGDSSDADDGVEADDSTQPPCRSAGSPPDLPACLPAYRPTYLPTYPSRYLPT